jgi:hypothetical protein
MVWDVVVLGRNQTRTAWGIQGGSRKDAGWPQVVEWLGMAGLGMREGVHGYPMKYWPGIKSN